MWDDKFSHWNPNHVKACSFQSCFSHWKGLIGGGDLTHTFWGSIWGRRVACWNTIAISAPSSASRWLSWGHSVLEIKCKISAEINSAENAHINEDAVTEVNLHKWLLCSVACQEIGKYELRNKKIRCLHLLNITSWLSWTTPESQKMYCWEAEILRLCTRDALTLA